MEPFFTNLPSSLRGPTVEIRERYMTRKYTKSEKKELSAKSQQLQLGNEEHLQLLVDALDKYHRAPVKVSEIVILSHPFAPFCTLSQSESFRTLSHPLGISIL